MRSSRSSTSSASWARCERFSIASPERDCSCRIRSGDEDWAPRSSGVDPVYDVVYHVLTNPVYAGIYCYGRRSRRDDPLTHKRHVQRRGRDELLVFLPHHHPGYLTLEQCEANMA